MALEGYYNRFNSAQKYVKTMFIAHRGLQSAELNELQEYTADALKRMGVDPFYDDDMRDQGIEQTGAIVNESLQLPIHINVLDYLKEEDLLLPYELEPIISQEARTGFMKVNPYDAFDPIPTDVTLKVDIDNWTEVETQWLSPITNYYYQFKNSR